MTNIFNYRILNNVVFFIIIIILLSFLVSFFWSYPFNEVFFFWDSRINFFDNNLINLNTSIFAERLTLWNSNETAAGSSRADAYIKAYPIFLEYILQNIFGFYNSQFFQFFITNSITWLSSFFLFRKISLKLINDQNFFYSFLFSLFYTLSFFYAVLIYTNPVNGFIYYFSFLPLNLVIFLYFLENKNNIFVFFLSSFLLSINISHLSLFMVTIYWYLFLFVLFINDHKYKKKFLFTCIFIYFLSSLPLLIPVILDGTSKLDFHISAVGGNYLDIFKHFSSLIKTITFNSYYNFLMQHLQNWGNWTNFFINNKLFSLIHLILFILSIYLILQTSKKYKNISIRLIILLFISLFIVTLPTNFFEIFNYVWNKFPIFSIYRGWDQKIAHIYYNSFLIFSFIAVIITHNQKIKKFFLTLFIPMFLIYSLPAFIGLNVFNKFHDSNLGTYGSNVSSKVKFPEEYFNLSKIFDSNEYARILSLPRDLTLNSDYFENDRAYAANYLISNITGKESSQGYEGDIYFSYVIYEMLQKNEFNSAFINDLYKYGITHIFLRKKFNNNHNFILPQQKSYEGLHSFIKNYSSILTDNEYFTLYSLNKRKEILQSSNVEIHQINSAIYEIHPKRDLINQSLDKDIVLEFNQSFNSNFIIVNTSNDSISKNCKPYKYIQQKELTICEKKNIFFDFNFLKLIFSPKIKNKTFNIVNNFSNEWVISQSDIKSFILFHKHQIIFYYLLLILSITGLMTFIVNILWYLYRK